jgi:hypothetical protein
MNMSVTQFVVPPAIGGRNRSVWREIIDTVIEVCPDQPWQNGAAGLELQIKRVRRRSAKAVEVASSSSATCLGAPRLGARRFSRARSLSFAFGQRFGSLCCHRNPDPKLS